MALSVMERPGNTLSPVLQNVWDGHPLQTMTKGAKGDRGAHIRRVDERCQLMDNMCDLGREEEQVLMQVDLKIFSAYFDEAKDRNLIREEFPLTDRAIEQSLATKRRAMQ